MGRVLLVWAMLWLVVGRLGAVEVDWEPDVYPSANLFPSLVIGSACVDPDAEIFSAWGGHHLGDPMGLVGASMAGLKKGDKFKLVVEANEFMRESVYQGTVAKNYRGDLVVHPKIGYLYDKLAGVTQTVPLDVTMELFVNGESAGKQSLTVTVRSINDCLFGVDEGGEAGSDYSWLFTAYVNEDHPWVDRLLKEALQTGIVSAFDGYQAESQEDVVRQVFAIWSVMQNHGMRYSDITTTSAERDGIYSQHVRFFDEAVTASQANCVDGSVLLAALLRKIGLHASLVLVPGHMFLAVALDDDTQVGIETTMMGEAEGDQRMKLAAFKQLAPAMKGKGWSAFEAAVAVGTKRLREEKENFESDNLEYQVIDLEEARRAGILPIKFRGPAGN